MHGAGGDNSEGKRVAGSRASAGECAAEVGTIEDRAVCEGSFVEEAAGRVWGVEEALLGTTPVGTRVFLRDGGGGGRGHDQELHRGATLGRRRRGRIQGGRPAGGLSQLRAGSLEAAFSRKRTFSPDQTYRL